jgi:hypothetical protein
MGIHDCERVDMQVRRGIKVRFILIELVLAICFL